MEITIEQFLKQPFEYKTAVELYKKHGNNSALAYLFSLGETQHNRQEVLKQLTDLAEKTKSKIAKSTKIKVPFTPIIESKKIKIDIDVLPPLLRQRNVDKGIIFYEMSHLHIQLCQANTDLARSKIRAQIIGRSDAISNIWKELEYFQEHKKLLVEPEKKDVVTLNIAQPPQENTAELFRQLTNVRAHVSKLKKKPHETEKLKAKLAEKLELETKLGITT